MGVMAIIRVLIDILIAKGRLTSISSRPYCKGWLGMAQKKAPEYDTLCALDGTPQARVRVVRRYKSVVKVKRWLGDGQWSGEEDRNPNDLLGDGGAAWGWNPPAGTKKGERLGYVRVSTVDQNLDRQLELIGDVDKLYEDKISGKSRADRVGLEQALNRLRSGDTLVVASIDRLARSLVDLREIVDQVVGEGAALEFIHERMRFSPDTTVDPTSKLMFQMLGAFAEFERDIIRERQKEGIAEAKKKGVYKGRKPALSAPRRDEVRRRAATGEKRAEIAEDLGVSVATVYRVLAG